ANGTLVDGVRIDGPTVVTAGATVVIGDYEIQLKGAAGARPGAPGKPRPAPKPVAHGPGEDREVRPTQHRAPVKAARSTKMVPAVSGPRPPRRAAPPASPREPGGGPCLRGLTGPWLNKRFPVTGSLIVGRVPGVDVQVEDDSVSRPHAELELRGGRVVVRDLGSANGTTVNGAPISEDTELASGDVLQFGVIEMAFEAGEVEVLKAPVRRKGRAVPTSDESDEEGGEGPGGGGWAALDPKKKRLIMIGGGVAALLLVAVFVKGMTGGDEPGPGPGGPGRPPIRPPVADLDPQALIAEHLAQCRSYAAADMGNPDWVRAESACNKVLDEDPIHPEANQLIKKIRVEKECNDYFTRGDKALSRLREEEALELFGKIGKDCSYYFKAKPKVKEAIAGVMKRTGEDCKRYLNGNQPVAALPRCELHLKFLCQSMTADQLYPPPGFKIVTYAGRLKKGDWRPKDPMYLRFLTARDKVDSQAPMWKCPPMEIFKVEQAPPGPRDEFAKAMAKRFSEKALVDAMLFYFDGRAGEAQTALLSLKEKAEKASVHALADDLRKQITSADQLYKEGQANLQAEDPERAAEPFREVLSIDEKLMGDQFDATQSFFRRNILQDMASKSYDKGKPFADRQDYRKACRVWKLGFSFYKGNAELLRALGNVCSNRAVQEMESAAACEDLTKVADYAVDGDGIKEKIEAKKTEWQCP
ncbi:MAG: FHA domain-containing protein, partial [Myxococcaceae bacterium]